MLPEGGGKMTHMYHTPMSLPLAAVQPLRSVHRSKHCVVEPVLYYGKREVIGQHQTVAYPLSLACTSAPCFSNSLTTDTLLYPHARCSGVDCNHSNSINNTFIANVLILHCGK